MSDWASVATIGAAMRGDRASVENLIEEIWPACYRLGAAVLGDPVLAQDAAQDTCVIVHRKIRTLRSPAAFNAWIYRTAMREIGRIRRKRPFCAESTDSFADPPDTISLDVWNALGRLPPDMRDVVVLFYFDDLKTSDIAAALKIPDTTVRTRLNRARDRLRDVLKEYQPLDPTEANHA